MRKVDRGTDPAPAALAKLDGDGRSELERARDHAASGDPDKKSFAFAVYKELEVKQRLERLFHGKCAYCETFYAMSAPVDVEHYRPKGAVGEDVDHPGYWWLAMDWHNLLPSCIDCNRRREQVLVQPGDTMADLLAAGRPAHKAQRTQAGKKDSFPVTGRRLMPEGMDYAGEGAVLLDPCRDDPAQHLVFHINHANPLGMVLPRAAPHPSRRGATSIQVYGLNRLRLVQDRTRVLRRLEFLGMLFLELTGMAAEMKDAPVAAVMPDGRASAIANRLDFLADQTLAEMRAMGEPAEPYSAMVLQWLRDFRDA